MDRRQLQAVALVVLIVALLGGFGLRMYLQRRTAALQAAADAAKEVPNTPVLVAKRDIRAGEAITADVINADNWTAGQAGSLPDDRIEDPLELYGGKATQLIPKDHAFTLANIVPPPSSASQKVEPGYRAITVPAPESPSLYDLKFLKADDRVDIFGVNAGGTQGGGTGGVGPRSISVRLADNVRILAVDGTLDEDQDQAKRKKMQDEVAKLSAQIASESDAATHPTGTNKELIASLTAQKDALTEELSAKPEHPSVTLQVRPEDAQRIALWRASAKIEIALHRRLDAQDVIFEGLPTGELSSEGVLVAQAPRSYLTLDDVVPEPDRDPDAFRQGQQFQSEQRRRAMEEETATLEEQLRREELKVDLSNLRRYGTRQPPPPQAAAIGPVPAVQAGPAGAPGDLAQRLQQLTDEVKRLRQENTVVPPATYRQPIEVIRGSERKMADG